MDLNGLIFNLRLSNKVFESQTVRHRSNVESSLDFRVWKTTPAIIRPTTSIVALGIACAFTMSRRLSSNAKKGKQNNYSCVIQFADTRVARRGPQRERFVCMKNNLSSVWRTP